MLNITIKGQQDVQRTLAQLTSALAVRDILDESGALLLGRIRRRFLAQQNPDGQSWVPSAASRKRASGRGGGTLSDPGRLFQSIQLYAEGENSRAIGTNVPYAAIHNFGLGNQLQRQFLGFGDEDATLVEKLLLKRVKEAMK